MLFTSCGGEGSFNACQASSWYLHVGRDYASNGTVTSRRTANSGELVERSVQPSEAFGWKLQTHRYAYNAMDLAVRCCHGPDLTLSSRSICAKPPACALTVENWHLQLPH